MEARTAPTRTVTLTPHPASPLSPIKTLRVDIDTSGSDLRLQFVAEGDIRSLDWPYGGVPGRAKELWRHTCFEAFLAGSDGYVEFNLAVEGQWASYHFSSYREGMRLAEQTATQPVLSGSGYDGILILESWLQVPSGASRLGLSAVLEAVDGTISYWALAHPSDKPDFHHPDSFVLDLP